MILTLDVETKNWSEDVEGGFENPAAFGVACLCVSMDGERFYTYVPGEFKTRTFSGIRGELIGKHEVTMMINAAETVLTFNGEQFDFNVLRGEGFQIEPRNSFDILAEFHKDTNRYISLDAFSVGTFGESKILDGRTAVEFYQAASSLNRFGRHFAATHLMSQVIRYCQDDVIKTYRLYQEFFPLSISYFHKETGRTVFWFPSRLSNEDE